MIVSMFCDVTTDLVVDRLWCGVVSLRQNPSSMFCKERSMDSTAYTVTPFVLPFTRRVDRRFVFHDDNAHAHRA